MLRSHFALLFFITTAAVASDWVRLTRQMGRSNQDHRDSVAALKKIKGLDAELNNELRGQQKYLALEVISELKLKSTLPRLFELSENDANGAIHLTLASLIDATNAKSIESLFLSHLTDAVEKGRTDVVRLILLDALARFQTPLDINLMHQLFASPTPELRHGILYYLSLQKDQKRPELIKRFVELGQKDPSEMVRSRVSALAKANP